MPSESYFEMTRSPKVDMLTNQELFEASSKLMPGGVNSPVRSFGSVGGTPYIVEKASGPFVYDIEGKRYIDYVQSYGAIILGHADPRVTSAISQAAAKGTSYGAPTPGELQLAELISSRVSGVEMLRLTSSGTEATMTALRIARGFTNRDKIVKFDGCYHGHSDGLLVQAGSGVANMAVSNSGGVPASVASSTIVVQYNEVPELDETVAAVIVEPVAANMGLVPPVEGFLAGLRAECDRVGALLIFDEVITGFRIAFGGAEEDFGIVADLYTFGKVIGGGLPIGAVGGRSDIMSVLAPVGPVYQAGTLSGNPVATAAGSTVLSLLEPASYLMLEGRAKSLASGMEKVMLEVDLEVVAQRHGPLFSLFFGSSAVTNFHEAKGSVLKGVFPYFFHAMLDRGVAMAPGPYEAIFVGLSHDWEQLDRTIDITQAAAKEARDKHFLASKAQ